MIENSRKGAAWAGVGGESKGVDAPGMPTAEPQEGVPVWTGPQGALSLWDTKQQRIPSSPGPCGQDWRAAQEGQRDQ